MLYSIKDKDDLGGLEELVSLRNQVIDLRLQNRPGKQNVRENMKNSLNQ